MRIAVRLPHMHSSLERKAHYGQMQILGEQLEAERESELRARFRQLDGDETPPISIIGGYMFEEMLAATSTPETPDLANQ